MSFEEDLKKLEQLSEKLKDENTPIEEAIKLFEEASRIEKKLSKSLEELERRVEKVTSESDDPILKTEKIEEE